MDSVSSDFLVLLLMSIVVGAIVGMAIGMQKGRGGEGFVLGGFLGVIGWIIVAVMAPSDEIRRRQRAELVADVRAASAPVAPVAPPPRAEPPPPVQSPPPHTPPVPTQTLPPVPDRYCPWCAEQIKAAARVCRFCGRDVEPLQALPGMPPQPPPIAPPGSPSPPR